MSKLCVYITIEHHKMLTWYMKSTKKKLGALIEEAINWFDPELHGPFVYAPFERVSRMVTLSDVHSEAIKIYSEGFEMTKPKVVSTILWLYMSHHRQEMKEVGMAELPSSLPLNLAENLVDKLEGKNVSKTVNDAIDSYIMKGLHKKRKVKATREKGVTRKRVNIYLSKKLREKLKHISNEMKACPQHVVVDALVEKLEGGDEQMF